MPARRQTSDDLIMLDPGMIGMIFVFIRSSPVARQGAGNKKAPRPGAVGSWAADLLV
jgi:hypothetical protein